MGLSDVMASVLSGRGPKYTALPVAGSGATDPTTVGSEQRSERRYPVDLKRAALKFIMGATTAVLIGSLVFTAFGKITQGSCVPRPCDSPEKGYQCHANITHSWGQYSPFFSVPSEIDASVPASCTVTFAQILSRHGARDPTASKTKTYSNLISRIHSSVTSYGPGFEFVRDYSYALGADQLTAFGQQEMANSGTKFYRRYRALARQSVLPFLRAAGQDRVVESAVHWTEGYHAQRAADDASDALPYDILTISEAAGVNNSLSHGLCTAFETGAYSGVGDAASQKFLAVFAPAVAARINAGLPGANLSNQEVVYLMDICTFETVTSAGGGTVSPFCGLFTAAEWLDYGYYQSVGKWYGYGPGNGLGAAQGVGWVNELVARLTGRPVVDRTSTNTTLDGDGGTFPLGRTLYADFSHDNDMMGVYAALGLYNGTEALSVERRQGEDETGGYAASWTVPFAAMMYVEKMVCGGGGEEMVRVLVNDRVVPLQNCGADELGRCGLGAFVESLGFARGGGNWDMCFA
ncbi:3-phytase A [Coniochaeta ligniaria NRRL 30616]|uniref:Phytase A n=1 Tax=Coniochaeta ligniaria NRRL 30616 TaxID=1408157 RepID=A0A1J7JQR4_9PEZI|nr:3-phytase A [Coniochaeta ligniaria NRRL 30616]